MSERNTWWWGQLAGLWRTPLPVALALLVGAAGGFLYSFVPLHGAERWQIDYLESRVDEQNLQIRELEESLASVRREAEARPDPTELAEEREAAASGRKQLESVKSQLARAERTIKGLRRSSGQWKSRYEKASAELEALQTAAAAPPPAAKPLVDPGAPAALEGGPVAHGPESSSVPGAAPPGSAPAAPAPVSAP